jgi:hypothetical protein
MAALVGAGLAKLGVADPAAASHGPADAVNAIHINVNNPSGAITTVTANLSASESTQGGVFVGSNTATLSGIGLMGTSNPTGGVGVFGHAGSGVPLLPSIPGEPRIPGGVGVWGRAGASAGGTGIRGDSASATGRGVLGASGPDGFGNGIGVQGLSGNGIGIQGTSNGGVGVQGFSNANIGVRADSISNYGLFATSQLTAVRGEADNTARSSPGWVAATDVLPGEPGAVVRGLWHCQPHKRSGRDLAGSGLRRGRQGRRLHDLHDTRG